MLNAYRSLNPEEQAREAQRDILNLYQYRFNAAAGGDLANQYATVFSFTATFSYGGYMSSKGVKILPVAASKASYYGGFFGVFYLSYLFGKAIATLRVGDHELIQRLNQEKRRIKKHEAPIDELE